MRPLIMLLALCSWACERGSTDRAAVSAPLASDVMLPGQAPADRSSAVVAKPADQAQLDRMILAGYTPHADHLHHPGVNKCPLTQDSKAVM